jgi:hypothetical protein
MANRVIDDLELRRMVEAGKSYREIAEHYNVTVSGVQQAVERIGLQRQSLSHKKAVPWQVAKAHLHSGPATSLRHLSRVSQGQEVPLVKVNTALRWATRLVDAGLDIDYTPETGFFERPADKDAWHIRTILRDAQQAMERHRPAD